MNSALNIYPEIEVSSFKLLFRLAGAAAIFMMVIVIVQLSVYITTPPPLAGTAADWFRLFQSNPLIGLINFEFLMVIYMLVSIPISVALYITLRKVDPSFTALYLALSLTGVFAFIAARPAFEMLSLSNGYAVATTELQKSMYLASGQSLLATFNGTAFYISYILGSLTGLMISFVMLKTNVFSKTTAYVRIASSVCDFGLFVPNIGLYISIFSVLFLFVWTFLMARQLFQLGRKSPMNQ